MMLVLIRRKGGRGKTMYFLSVAFCLAGKFGTFASLLKLLRWDRSTFVFPLRKQGWFRT
jgi:hypothetical protein